MGGGCLVLKRFLMWTVKSPKMVMRNEVENEPDARFFHGCRIVVRK